MPAPAGNKNAVGNKGGGRRSTFNPDFIKIAKRLALLGLTDVEMAQVLEVSERTFNTWKKKHVEFSTALKKAKEIADARVAQSLFERATGYSHPHQEIMLHQKTGDPVVVDTVKHYPPDTTAAIFWLKNRQPDKWRDKTNIGIAWESMSDENLDKIIEGLKDKAYDKARENFTS